MAVPARQLVISQEPIIFSKKVFQETEKKQEIENLQKLAKQEAAAAELINTEFEIEDPSIIDPSKSKEKKKEKDTTVEQASESKQETELRTIDYTKMKAENFEAVGSGTSGKVWAFDYLDPTKNKWITYAYKRFYKHPKGHKHGNDLEINEIRRWIQIGTENIEGLCQLIGIVHSDPEGLEEYPNKIFDTIQKKEIIPKGISLMFDYCSAFTLENHLNLHERGRSAIDEAGKSFTVLKPDYPLAIQWSKTLFSALAKIHSKKIIHGDISNHNVMFNFEMENSIRTIKIKLIDLGLSYSWEEDYQKRDTHILKELDTRRPQHPPELHCEHRDHFPPFSTKSDVFSLSFVLTELLLGRNCESSYASKKEDLYRDVKKYMIPDLWDKRGYYPALVDILIGCLKENPKERCEAAEIVSKLENLKQKEEERRRNEKCVVC